jgi:hypothetical protein
MDTLVKLQAEELTDSLIDFIKSSFKGKRIAVHIYEDSMDETEYLFSDAQHKQELLEAVDSVKKGNFQSYSFEEIKNMVK